MAFISAAVEGVSDEAVVRRLIDVRGAEVHRVQVQHGKQNLRRALPGYNGAAQGDPWLVLVDLDQDYACGPLLVADWLLADADRFSDFFGVARQSVPEQPDDLPDAKAAVLVLAAQSSKRAIRDDMVPRPRSGRRVGPAYTSRMMEFATRPADGWRPDIAATRSPSLSRCITRLDELIAAAP